MNELKQLRKQLGFTQEKAAELCGVSRRTYQTYEDGYTDNKTYRAILDKLNKLEDYSLLSLSFIKKTAREVFVKYPEVKCVYLYGSYARGDATSESDVDFMIVCHGMGLNFFTMVVELEDSLHKKVDLQTHEQVGGNADFLENILVDGIRIYKKH